MQHEPRHNNTQQQQQQQQNNDMTTTPDITGMGCNKNTATTPTMATADTNTHGTINAALEEQEEEHTMSNIPAYMHTLTCTHTHIYMQVHAHIRTHVRTYVAVAAVWMFLEAVALSVLR